MCATKEDYIRRLKDDFEKTSGPCEFYAHGLEVFQQFLGTISMASLGITFFLTWVIQVSFLDVLWFVSVKYSYRVVSSTLSC